MTKREKLMHLREIIELVKNEKYRIEELCTEKINISTVHNSFCVCRRCSI